MVVELIGGGSVINRTKPLLVHLYSQLISTSFAFYFLIAGCRNPFSNNLEKNSLRLSGRTFCLVTPLFLMNGEQISTLDMISLKLLFYVM